MAADNGQMSFRRGVMSLVILGLLKKQDMYGYQLVQETERKSGGRIVTQAHDPGVLSSGTRRGAAAERIDSRIRRSHKWCTTDYRRM